jgi:adenylate cyclase
VSTSPSPGRAVGDVARQIGVTPATLRRWISSGVIPASDGPDLSETAVSHARAVARLRARGHTLKSIREASASGRLATSSIEGLLPRSEGHWTLEAAAAETGLAPSLIKRVFTAVGFGASVEHLSDGDVEMLRHVADVLDAGLPLVAFLQLMRVYGQAISQIADAEVRLFHLYVHEPLMRDGVPGWEMAEQMQGMAGAMLPLALPVMGHAHNRFLQHFMEQDIVGHMEADPDQVRLDLGRLRVAIAFADLAGYTRLTEDVGDEEAVSAVERFVEQVERTLPEDARIIKTLGDEVMIVGPDPAALAEWAVDFQRRAPVRPLPRIGIHHGETLYRDGDYYGREVNRASRVAARSAGGEVLVTSAVVEAAGDRLAFHLIGAVRLKGFTEATELFLALSPPER